MTDHEKLMLSPEEMREAGYRVIDMLVEHITTLPDKPVTRKGKHADLDAALGKMLPEKGIQPMQALDLLENQVFNHIMHLDHPRFFAFIPSPSNYMGILADALVSGFNVFAGTWLEASGPAMIEMIVLDWLRQACGLPAGAGGIFVSGGSMANLTALAVARQVHLGKPHPQATLYCSDQTHSSISRGLKVLGFHSGQLRVLPSDANYRLELAALYQAVEADLQSGCQPFCVLATAGTTNTGAIDPLRELAEYCQKMGLWLHIDGAYGASAVFSERGRKLLTGLEYADSLSIDPHKWLFQPYEIGCLLVRDESWLKKTFHILPEYLADIEEQESEINFCDRGIQLTRNFRALKLWLTLKTFGAKGLESAINRGFEMAEYAAGIIEDLPDWHVVTPPQMGILTFHYAPSDPRRANINQLNESLVGALIEDGYAMLSTTTLRGTTVLRMCTINPRTTETDIQETLYRLNRIAKYLTV